MKYWKCKHCARRKITEDNIILALCEGCQKEMEVIKHGNQDYKII